MRIAVRFPKVAYLQDLNLGLARSVHGDLKWRGVHSERANASESWLRVIDCMPTNYGTIISTICLFIYTFKLYFLLCPKFRSEYTTIRMNTSLALGNCDLLKVPIQ